MAGRSKEKLAPAKPLTEAEQFNRLPERFRDRKWLGSPVKSTQGFAPVDSIWFDPETGDRYESNPFGYFECLSGWVIPQRPDHPLISEEYVDLYCELANIAEKKGQTVEAVRNLLQIFGVALGAKYPAAPWSDQTHELIKTMLDA